MQTLIPVQVVPPACVCLSALLPLIVCIQEGDFAYWNNPEHTEELFIKATEGTFFIKNYFSFKQKTSVMGTVGSDCMFDLLVIFLLKVLSALFE